MAESKAHSFINLYIDGMFEIVSGADERRAGDYLFNNLENIEDVIPMLQSSFETAQYQACYIVSETGDDAAKVFPYVAPLINSPFASVRGIVCDCYLWSASTGEHAAEVIKCLEDTDRSVRLAAIWTLRHFRIELITAAIAALRERHKAELAEAVDKFFISETAAHDISLESMRSESRLNKFCYYIAVRRADLYEGDLKRFVRALGDPDLMFSHRRH